LQNVDQGSSRKIENFSITDNLDELGARGVLKGIVFASKQQHQQQQVIFATDDVDVN